MAVYKTTNGGNSWVTSYQVPGNGFLTDLISSVCFPDPATGIIAGQNGMMMRSNDSAMTWNALSSHFTIKDIYSVHFTNSNTGFVTGDEGTIIKTSDGGNTWATIPSGTNDSLLSICFTDLNTDDGGETWAPVLFTLSNYNFGFLDQTHVFKNDIYPGLNVNCI